LLARREDLALVDPDLAADAAVLRARLVEAVVDVGAQRRKRDAALPVGLGARHLGPPEAAGALHLDPAGTGTHGLLHGPTHGAPERHAPGDLLGDGLCEQRRLGLRLLDLVGVDANLVHAGHLLDLLLEVLDLGPPATDHDAGTRREDVDADAVARPLDVHARDHAV